MIKPTLPYAARCAAYERALHEPHGIPWADDVCRAFGALVRDAGFVEGHDYVYTWDRCLHRVNRHPTPRHARRVDSRTPRVHHDHWTRPEMVNNREVLA